MIPLSYYTEKNGLAQFWNRDFTRLEWARWVYHHPEQTEKLVEILLSYQDTAPLLINEINERLDANDRTDERQDEDIRLITAGEFRSISIEELQRLLGVEEGEI